MAVNPLRVGSEPNGLGSPVHEDLRRRGEVTILETTVRKRPPQRGRPKAVQSTPELARRRTAP